MIDEVSCKDSLWAGLAVSMSYLISQGQRIQTFICEFLSMIRNGLCCAFEWIPTIIRLQAQLANESPLIRELVPFLLTQRQECQAY